MSEETLHNNQQFYGSTEDNEILVAWTYKEYENPERSRRWYIWTSVFGLALIITAVLMSDFLFALIVILSAIVLVILHTKEVEEINFMVTEQGIILGEKLFDFKDFKSFWLVYEPVGAKNLYLEFKSSIRGRLRIPLVETNPLTVREVLLEFLKEDLDKEDEPSSEIVAKKLGIYK